MLDRQEVNIEHKPNGYTDTQNDVPAARVPFIREAARALTTANLARLSVDAQPLENGNFTVTLTDAYTDGMDEVYNRALQNGNTYIALLAARAAERAVASSGQNPTEELAQQAVDQVVNSLANHPSIYNELRKYILEGRGRASNIGAEIAKIEGIKTGNGKDIKKINPTVPLTKYPVVAEALRDWLKVPDVPMGIVSLIAVSDDRELHREMVDNFSSQLARIAEEPGPDLTLQAMRGFHLTTLESIVVQGLEFGRYPLAEQDLVSMYSTLKNTDFKHDPRLNGENSLGPNGPRIEQTVAEIVAKPL